MAREVIHIRGTAEQAEVRQTKSARKPQSRRTKHAALLRVATAVALLDGISATMASASTLTWDSDAMPGNGVTDGSGTWDTSTLQWYSGSSDSAWNNSNNDTAVFGNGGSGGTNPYTVTLGAAITVGGLTFNTSSSASSYTIAGGGNTLTFGGSSTNDLVTTNANATISALLAATGSVTTLQKAGSGILALSGGGTFSNAIISGPSTGSLFITGGTFTVGGMNFYDAGGDNNTTDGLVFQTGGAVSTSKDWDGRNKTSSYDITGGTLTATTPNRIRDIGTFNASGNATVTFNTPDARISSDNWNGALSINGSASVTFSTSGYIDLNDSGGTGNTASGTINLNGGTLTTIGFSYGGVSTTTGVINFNGGTLKASSSQGTSFFSANASVTANVYGGGAIVDTNGQTNNTISQALLGTTGNGVDTVTVNAGGSYTTAPTVTFSAPTSGTTAKGYALINTAGAVTSIVITNPGSGYTSMPTVTFGSGAATATSTANLNNAGGGLTKLNAGTLTLSATSNTYTGATIISGGTLALSASSTNNISSSKAITVGSGAILNVSNLSSGTIALASGQALGGVGTVTGATIVSSGSTISAGTSTTLSTGTANTTGKLTTGNEKFAAGGTYAVKINDVTGTSGNATGWDDLSMGTLDATALGSSTTFAVKLSSSGASAAHFDKTSNYTWVIANITTGSLPITGPMAVTNSLGNSAGTTASSLFTLDTSAFVANNPVLGSGSSFYLEALGSVGGSESLEIGYSATPEPGAAILAFTGVVPMLLGRRRRAKSSIV